MRVGRAVAGAAAGACLLAPPAGAHVHTGALAVGYRISVDRAPPGVSASVAASDRALTVTALDGHVVVVRGYAGELFLRLDPEGVDVNPASPTARATGLLHETPATGWFEGPARRSATWHDARLAGGSDRRWTVPILLDGVPATIGGRIRPLAAPSPALPLALGLPFVALAAVLARRRPEQRRRAATATAAVAAAATIAGAAGFMLDDAATASKWMLGGNETVLALAGLLALAFGHARTRPAVAGALGLLALFAGLAEAALFTKAIALSVLPDDVARAAAALAIGAGLAAVVLAVSLLGPELASSSPPRSSRRAT
jgi:hypothetical protein